MNYDVVVIGGGPGGTKAAIELGQAGKKVALIENIAIGGTCLNRGCIPSKTYLYLVEILDAIKKAKRHGIEVAEPTVVWEQAKKRKDMNVKMLGMGLSKTVESAGVEIIHGQGLITAANEVTVNTEEGERKLNAEKIILAVGSKPIFLPFMPKGEHVISAKDLIDLEEMPESLAIIGGGVTGVEMASVFSSLGTQVTLIELQDALLPTQDREITTQLKKSLEKRGVKILLNTQVTSCKDQGAKAEVIYKNEDGEVSIEVDKALVVIGRRPNYDLEQLAALGLENDGRRLVLNDQLQTSLTNIYVIGDAAFKNLTAYGAEREGEVVAAHILGHERTINYEHIPVTVFCHPELGSIGLTEEQACEKGIDYELKKSDFAANAKAIVTGEREGMVKIIVEKASQKILGVHIIGSNAADLIHQALLPVMQEMTVQDWLEVVWSHPVISEVLKAALESKA